MLEQLPNIKSKHCLYFRGNIDDILVHEDAEQLLKSPSIDDLIGRWLTKIT